RLRPDEEALDPDPRGPGDGRPTGVALSDEVRLRLPELHRDRGRRARAAVRPPFPRKRRGTAIRGGRGPRADTLRLPGPNPRGQRVRDPDHPAGDGHGTFRTEAARRPRRGRARGEGRRVPRPGPPRVQRETREHRLPAEDHAPPEVGDRTRRGAVDQGQGGHVDLRPRDLRVRRHRLVSREGQADRDRLRRGRDRGHVRVQVPQAALLGVRALSSGGNASVVSIRWSTPAASNESRVPYPQVTPIDRAPAPFAARTSFSVSPTTAHSAAWTPRVFAAWKIGSGNGFLRGTESPPRTTAKAGRRPVTLRASTVVSRLLLVTAASFHPPRAATASGIPG